jgi:hypothetical protein
MASGILHAGRPYSVREALFLTTLLPKLSTLGAHKQGWRPPHRVGRIAHLSGPSFIAPANPLSTPRPGSSLLRRLDSPHVRNL